MSVAKPYHKIHRALVDGPNSGHSSVAYLKDKAYAQAPAHYVRAFLLIQDDLKRLFEYVEPSEECLLAFSYRIHELLMRTCIELEANCKAILNENIFTATKAAPYTISTYKVINKTHHLSSFEVTLPIWNGAPRVMKPFEQWDVDQPLPWYKAYNASKHDRQEQFRQANLDHLLSAVAGLLIVLSAQFGTEDYSSG